jgi:hypothetical protein
VDLEQLASGWLSLSELAEQIGVPLPKVRQAVREGQLVAVTRGAPAMPSVPSDFVHDGKLIKGLAGALTVLRDAGYTDTEALRWLLSDDPNLPGRPVDVMAAGRDTAVKRRAQVLAF